MRNTADNPRCKCPHLYDIANIMKTKTLSFRLEVRLHEALDEMERETQVERANILRSLIVAAHAFYQEHGYIQMPFKVIATPKAAKTPGR